MLTTCVSCVPIGNRSDNTHTDSESTTTSQNNTPVEEASAFLNYDDILNTITLLYNVNGESTFRAEHPDLNARESFIFDHLSDFICGGIGYCVKDINGDGIEELIMLTENWRLRGLFTMQNGVPVLLEQCDHGGIGRDGKIRVEMIEETNEGTRTIYRLKSLENGALVTEVEFGETLSHDETRSSECYQVINGERVKKTAYDIVELRTTYSFRDYFNLTPDVGITCTRLLDIPTPMENGEYFAISSLKNADDSRTYFYEIYDKDNNTVLSGETDRVYIYEIKTENDTVVSISVGSDRIYYSVEQSRFSERFQESIWDTDGKLIVYFRGESDQKRLVVQNIFDKSLFYKEYDHEICNGSAHFVRFSQDGKSLTLKYRLPQNSNSTTNVLCLETLPILRTKKICYIRYESSISSDFVYASSGVRAVLRADTNDTIRLLRETPIIGGEYESEDGIRNDWYFIDYLGRSFYVTADSFEVDTFIVTEAAD